VVNDLDLYRVWQNLLKLPANRDLNEDLNRDGQVDSADLNVVTGHYLANVPPAPLTPAPGGIESMLIARLPGQSDKSGEAIGTSAKSARPDPPDRPGHSGAWLDSWVRSRSEAFFRGSDYSAPLRTGVTYATMDRFQLKQSKYNPDPWLNPWER
jgi:hypothetical protein